MSGKTLLDVQHVSKAFGGVQAVQDCSLTVEQGTITALIGPNGCGKTTLFNLITQLEDEDEGIVDFKTAVLTSLKPHQVAKAGVSRTFQHPRLFANLTVQDHIEIALLETDESLLKSTFTKQDSLMKKAQEALDKIGFNKPLETLGSDLSYGQRKLLDLAIALAKPHKILLLDEPVAGVNPQLRKQIKKLLVDLKKQGETIFVIEHDMNFVMGIADWVHVMDQGSVIVSGKPGVVRRNKRVLEAYLGK